MDASQKRYRFGIDSISVLTMKPLLFLTTLTVLLTAGCGSGNNSTSPINSTETAPASQPQMSAAEMVITSPIPDEVVSRYRLNTDYYHKMIRVWGIPVLAPSQVDDTLLKNAAEVIAHQLSDQALIPGLQPQIRDRLLQRNFRVVIFATTYGQYGSKTVPEYASFEDVAGYGATPDLPLMGVTSSALEYTAAGNNPDRGNTMIHELTHSIHLLALSDLMPEFDNRLQQSYQQAMAEGRWQNSRSSLGYINTNRYEYLAVGSELWHNLRATEAQQDWDRDTDLHQHLQNTDPDLYNLLAEFYDSRLQLPQALTPYQGVHTLKVQLRYRDYPAPLDLNQMAFELVGDGQPFSIAQVKDPRVRTSNNRRYHYGFSSADPNYDLDQDLFLPRLTLNNPDYVNNEYRIRLLQQELTLMDCQFSKQQLLAHTDAFGVIRVEDPLSCTLVTTD
ncbi:hypothetical protein [Ferrimonas kyonanensis]|uniref:hypothetical protein n=1 Tax=Ferrimonas kyonanensis TaxID=364763 RepID=UPI000421C959|nr:hypothetical protein [Ferrimonas kyonanensis]